MYIHIGGEYSIPGKTILGIFDFDSIMSGNRDSLGFLRNAENKNLVENVSFDIPRSVVVAIDRVYIPPISARTIRKRAGNEIIETSNNERKG